MAGNGLLRTSSRQADSSSFALTSRSHSWMFSPAGHRSLHGGSRSTYTGIRDRTGPALPTSWERSGSSVMSRRLGNIIVLRPSLETRNARGEFPSLYAAPPASAQHLGRGPQGDLRRVQRHDVERRPVDL